MIGRHVKHRTFGIGSIIGNEAGKITVDFSGTVRLFQFPMAFERFLITDDAVLKSMVDEAIKESAAARKKAEEERRMAKEAEEAAVNTERKAIMPASLISAISAMAAPAPPALDFAESVLIR